MTAGVDPAGWNGGQTNVSVEQSHVTKAAPFSFYKSSEEIYFIFEKISYQQAIRLKSVFTKGHVLPNRYTYYETMVYWKAERISPPFFCFGRTKGRITLPLPPLDPHPGDKVLE